MASEAERLRAGRAGPGARGRGRRRWAWVALASGVVGCTGAAAPAPLPSSGALSREDVAQLPAPRSDAPASTASVAAGHPPPGVMAPSAARPPGAAACGPFECRWFDSAADALELVLRERPLALGIGEAHALAGTEHVASTARRFADQLLPLLAGRASHLVVELLNPDPRCADATREVRRAQEPVTAPQSKHNQDDYVGIGLRARELGIEPFVLSPTCDEYRAIAAAGSASIDQMLTTIAAVTSRMLRGALARNHAAGRDALVLGYGGALHNDLNPVAAKAPWSYGPDLAAFTRGRYVELDLIVPELIRDTDAWRALPWYEHFEPERSQGRWLVMRMAPNGYVLFFPKAAPSAP